mmetsp:Transcript_49975/g.99242  ORF Transcript_49975/g.99242 Transcript_49975/m.99242 type:complete len:229 (-) Transcript_49975:10-696(-)
MVILKAAAFVSFDALNTHFSFVSGTGKLGFGRTLPSIFFNADDWFCASLPAVLFSSMERAFETLSVRPGSFTDAICAAKSAMFCVTRGPPSTAPAVISEGGGPRLSRAPIAASNASNGEGGGGGGTSSSPSRLANPGSCRRSLLATVSALAVRRSARTDSGKAVTTATTRAMEHDLNRWSLICPKATAATVPFSSQTSSRLKNGSLYYITQGKLSGRVRNGCTGQAPH